MGNGKYLIVFSVEDQNGTSPFPEYYYRVFDTSTGQFSNSPTFLGAPDQPAGGGLFLEFQEKGRVFLRSDSNFFAEVTDNGSGFDHIFGDVNHWTYADVISRPEMTILTRL